MKPKCEVFKAEDFEFHKGPVSYTTNEWIADRCNAILSERGVVVYGNPLAEIDHTGKRKPCFYGYDEPDKFSTHTALLINIQPIKQDTAESLLNEALMSYDNTELINKDWHNRVRKWLRNK